jgi:hypothetical protein
MTRVYAGAVALAALAWGCVVLALVLQHGYGVTPADGTTGSTDVVLGLAWPALALLVLRQQPGNRLLWLFLVIGVGMGLFLAGTDLAVILARNDLPGAVTVDWLGVGAGEFAWPLLWLTVQLFPTGRPLPGRFWRWVFGLSLFWYGVNFVQVLFTPDRHDTYRDGNPYASESLDRLLRLVFRPVDAAEGWIGTSPAFLAILVFGVVSFVLRYRRGTAVSRAQLRALGVGLVVVIAVIPLTTLADERYRSWAVALAFLLLPASFGVAILRHGLYDLDRLVSRAATYALLTGLLIGVYLALVALTNQVLRLGSSLSAALATLAAAALFQPLRHALQKAVDRRFHRARYDALAQVEDFAVRLRDPVSTEAIAGDLLEVVDRTVQPASATLWLVRSTG